MKIYILTEEEVILRENNEEEIIYKQIVAVFRSLEKAEQRLKRIALRLERKDDAKVESDAPYWKDIRLNEKTRIYLRIEVHETE